jgi:hypothetical protein
MTAEVVRITDKKSEFRERNPQPLATEAACGDVRLTAFEARSESRPQRLHRQKPANPRRVRSGAVERPEDKTRWSTRGSTQTKLCSQERDAVEQALHFRQISLAAMNPDGAERQAGNLKVAANGDRNGRRNDRRG